MDKKRIMELEKKFALTDKQYEKGLNKIRLITFANKKSVENPTMVLVGGQQGSGKSQLLINNGFSDGNVVIISLDDFAVHNPHASKIKRNCPDLFAHLTLESGYKWRKSIYNEVVDGRYNGITEMALKDKENDPKLVKSLKDNGVKVVARVMATSLYESVISVYERYEEQLSSGIGYPKLTESTSAYDKIPEAVETLEDTGLLDTVEVYIRGRNYVPIRVYSSLEKEQYGSARQALETERNRNLEYDQQSFLIRTQGMFNRLNNRQATAREVQRMEEDVKFVCDYYNIKSFDEIEREVE